MTAESAAGEETPEQLRLSPSEAFAHDSAVRVSGSDGTARTQRALASIVLGFELFVVFLIGLAVFGLRLFEPAWLGLVGGGAICLLILVALATMRFGRVGIVLGWIVQAAMLLFGVVLPMSLIASAIFSVLWIYCMAKGAAIDRDRAAWYRSQRDGSAAG